jgi:hypothetical protein
MSTGGALTSLAVGFTELSRLSSLSSGSTLADMIVLAAAVLTSGDSGLLGILVASFGQTSPDNRRGGALMVWPWLVSASNSSSSSS